MTACAAALLLCLVAATGYSEAPWHARRHEDSHALAQTIFKQWFVDFEFPNVSFFAQYVKKYLGMTPTEYRNSSQEKK